MVISLAGVVIGLGLTPQSFEFIQPVPGFVADFEQVDFRALYPESEVREVDLEGLHEYLRGLPCCAVADDGAPVVASAKPRETRPGLRLWCKAFGLLASLLVLASSASKPDSLGRARAHLLGAVAYSAGPRASARAGARAGALLSVVEQNATAAGSDHVAPALENCTKGVSPETLRLEYVMKRQQYLRTREGRALR